MMIHSRHNLRWATLLLALTGVMAARGAVIYLEPFADNTAAWTSTGLTSFGHSSTEGNPTGSLVGSMNPGLFPQFGAFVAEAGASSGNFVGDYLDAGALSIKFDFYSATVAPQTLSLVLSSGSSSFVYSFSPLASLTSWASYIAPINTSSGWSGSGSFNSVLTNVDKVQIQFASDVPGSQSFYLDNFELSGESIAVIPEPGVAWLMLWGVAGIILIRRIRSNAVEPRIRHIG